VNTRVLIAGCGYVGRELARILVGDGDAVFALTRSGRPEIPGTTPVRADMTAPDSLDALPGNLDTIVFTAGSDESSDDAYRRIYVDGLRNLLERTSKHSPGLERLIVASSTGVYGQDRGELVDENSETHPTRFSGRRMLESEQVAASAPCKHVVVRFGGIYGPGRTRFLERIRSGDAELTASRAYTNRIHRDDCASALRHLLRLEDPASVYLAVDNEAADRNEVIRWLSAELGVAPPAPAAGPAQPASGKRCSNRRLLATGYAFRYPTFREGYGQMLGEPERDDREDPAG
jgi:nucleoside-diphosphate-sugar epimerase